MWVPLKICLYLVTTINIVHAQSTSNICEIERDHSLVSFNVSCNMYFECIENVAYLLSCPRGLYFSVLKQSCDLPSNVECEMTTSTTQVPTTPVQPITSCNNIPNFEYILSPDSCSQYYQCIDGVAFLLSCPRGLYFSEIIQTCDLPSNVNCPSTSPAPPGPTVSCLNVENFKFIASPASCSFYYQCIDDVPYLVSCPRGLYFNELIQTCDYSGNVHCKTISSTPRPPPSTPNCENKPDNILLSSPNSCSLYYQCFANVSYLVSCPRGLYFNELIQICDFPSNVDCEKTIAEPTGPIVPTVPSAPTVDASNMCESIDDGTSLASKTYCERYYVCTGGFPRSKQCGAGLHFNPQTLVCDDAENVNCLLETIPTIEPTTTTEMGFEGYCTNAVNTTFVRNPISCSEYFQCINNEPHGRECDGRLWFNYIQQRCTDPFETFCILSRTLCNGVDDEQRIRSATSCSDYIICFEGEPFPRFCNNHQWFDESRQICDDIENIECDLEDLTKSPIASECNGVRDFRLVRSRDNCTDHFVCISNEITQRLTCHDGQWFDTDLQTCNDASNVTCNINTIYNLDTRNCQPGNQKTCEFHSTVGSNTQTPSTTEISTTAALTTTEASTTTDELTTTTEASTTSTQIPSTTPSLNDRCSNIMGVETTTHEITTTGEATTTTESQTSTIEVHTTTTTTIEVPTTTIEVPTTTIKTTIVVPTTSTTTTMEVPTTSTTTKIESTTTPPTTTVENSTTQPPAEILIYKIIVQNTRTTIFLNFLLHPINELYGLLVHQRMSLQQLLLLLLLLLLFDKSPCSAKLLNIFHGYQITIKLMLVKLHFLEVMMKMLVASLHTVTLNMKKPFTSHQLNCIRKINVV
ncbi:unnamed protein product, partial [Diamesa serratosioi]